MKTEQITVTGNGIGIDKALEATEKLGNEAGLDKKSALHLRLIAEELFGILRGIAGEVEACCWAQAEGRAFEVCMKSEVKMTDELRERLIAVSTSGKNSAALGVMGKIRVMIADMLVSAKETMPYAIMNTAAAYNAATPYVWTMSEYKTAVKNDIENSREAWDELEKSVIANIADDVKVSILGKSVGITVYKTFK